MSSQRLDLPLDQRHLSVLLARQAADFGTAPFLTVSDCTYSFAEVQERVLRLSSGLASAGVTANDLVGVMLPNCAEFVFTWFAAAHLGAATVVMNPELRGHMLDLALVDCDCRLVVMHADVLAGTGAQVEKLAESGVPVAVVGEATGLLQGCIPFSTLAECDASPTSAVGDYRSIQTVSFTSGSTGPSKGVRITNNQAIDTACTFIHAMALTSDDVLFTPFALFHGMSNRLAVIPCLLAGAHVVLAENFSASRYWQQAAACGATVAQTLPTVNAMLKAQPPSPADLAHRVTRMYNSRVDHEFERRFGVRLVEAYGMTEIGVVLYTPYGDRRDGACGRLHPGWDMQIVDENDWPLPSGQAGEMVLRPRLPHLMCAGYMNRPQAFVEATSNLWFHTGDIGRMDTDGYVFFMDRRKERIRRRGENISSFEAEFIVAAHPAVRECAVLPHPAALGEDDVRLVVVADPAARLDGAALWAWLKDRMPRFMLPRYIEFSDRLPRTHNNKIEKFRLLANGLAPDVWDAESAVVSTRKGDRATSGNA